MSGVPLCLSVYGFAIWVQTLQTDLDDMVEDLEQVSGKASYGSTPVEG